MRFYLLTETHLLTQLARLIPLSRKQRFLLVKLNENPQEGSASQFVSECPMALSTAWHNLRQLRTMGLVRFGGGTLEVTQLGAIVAESKTNEVVERGKVFG